MDVINTTTALIGYKSNGSSRGGSTSEEGVSEKVPSLGHPSVSACPRPVAWQKQNDYFGLCPGQPQKIQFTAQ